MVRVLPFLLLLSASRVALGGPVVVFEGDQFPDSVGWDRSPRLFLADRAVENGWFVQQAEVIPKQPPNLNASEDDFYTRSLAEFTGVDFFFIEWRIETDGPRTGFGNVSPAGLVAYGFRNVMYHFTIADDRVRLIRDNLLPIVFVDIEPGVPHTYLLELYGSDLYQFFIDGELIDSGVPEGAYPTPDSEIVFGARAATPEGTTTVRWDYIRYGMIPEPATAALLLLGTTFLTMHRKSRTH